LNRKIRGFPADPSFSFQPRNRRGRELKTKKGTGLRSFPFLFNKFQRALAPNEGRETFSYISALKSFNYLRIRGFVGSSFFGFFSFLVAMLRVPPNYLVCPAWPDVRL
jgi:hypothetical protein